MKKKIFIIIISFIILAGLQSPAFAKMVSQDDALKAANNWIALIINKKGVWGGSDTAEVQEIRELKQKGKKIGWFCKISPQGFIFVSLRKELAPVKAYSSDSNIDPDSDEGLADLIKGKMAGVINGIEKRLGVLDKIPSQALQNILEVNYNSAWDELIGTQGEMTPAEMSSGAEAMSYMEGGILLSSSWHQGAPYNNDTPAGSYCTHTVVGCVATAGAQIMYYWNWPPYGVGSSYNDSYDWRNMDDRVTVADPAADQAAVAELSHEVGVAVSMNYGCSGPPDDGSGAFTYNMEGVFENQYRYSTSAVRRNRTSYTAVPWFNLMKVQFNINRPVQYRIKGHSIVGDGWQEIGAGPTRQYHMNYGWNNGNNAWYTLDALHQPGGGTNADEYLIENIVPVTRLGTLISGTYLKAAFPYRYFDRDATGASATFNAGQNLQFLPEITLTNTSTTGSSFTFDSLSSSYTRLFTRGDTGLGAKLMGGSIKMYQNGSIKFY